MKLLIFFLIFFLLFTPTVIAEDDEETFSINVQVLDLSGIPVSGLRFALIDHNGVERGSGITTSGKDGNIPGNVESFGTTQNKNDETMNGYPLEMVIFYYNGPVADKPESRGRYLEIIGSSKRCFENNSEEYIIYVNELNDEPAAVVMYNMTHKSLNLATQSKETADESYNLSLYACVLAFISFAFMVISLLNTITINLIRIYHSHYNIIETKHIQQIKTKLQILIPALILMILIIIMMYIYIKYGDYFYLWVATLISNALITTAFIIVNKKLT